MFAPFFVRYPLTGHRSNEPPIQFFLGINNRPASGSTETANGVPPSNSPSAWDGIRGTVSTLNSRPDL